MTTSLGQANGGFASNASNFWTTIPTSWQIVGSGDFNGDGRDDLLWRNPSTGQTTDWLGQANGSFAGNDANAQHYRHQLAGAARPGSVGLARGDSRRWRTRQDSNL